MASNTQASTGHSSAGSGIANAVSGHVQGSGNWSAGTTVREIEGHFHKENEPKNTAPISGTGGVPNVDYVAQKADQVKDKLTGHK